MINKILILLQLLSFTSCALIIEKLQDKESAESAVKLKEISSKTFCKMNQVPQILSADKLNQQVFEKFIKKMKESRELTSIDKDVLLSLSQMNTRPDLSSPTAKLQILIKNGKKEKYYNVWSKDKGSFPSFYLLEKILKDYKSKYSLLALGKIYDQNYPNRIYINSELEIFLSKNKANILKNPKLKRIYTRADETLKEKERIPKVKLSPLIRRYLKNKKKYTYNLTNDLFSYNENSLYYPKCNFDLTMYEKSLFLISDDIVKDNIYGLATDGHRFMASTNQSIQHFELLKNSLFLKGNSNVRSASVCSFQFPQKPKSSQWFFSSNSRDPGQHIFHLIEYGINESKTLREVNSMLNFSRHQFLKDPVRLIIESQRSTKRQLSQLLKLNISIYSAKKLGKIWGLHAHKGEKSFLTDQREIGELNCKE